MDLKNKRITKGLTQIDMALKLGVSLSSYRLYEKGVQNPKPETKKQIEKILGVKY